MATIIAINCPRCGSPLPVLRVNSIVTCTYCKTRSSVSAPAQGEDQPTAQLLADDKKELALRSRAFRPVPIQPKNDPLTWMIFVGFALFAFLLAFYS